MTTYSYLSTPAEIILATMNGQPFHAELNLSDAELIRQVVNQGIDAHLEAVTDSDFRWECGKLVCRFAPPDLVVILRRLGELDAEAALDLRLSLLSALGIEEI